MGKMPSFYIGGPVERVKWITSRTSYRTPHHSRQSATFFQKVDASRVDLQATRACFQNE